MGRKRCFSNGRGRSTTSSEWIDDSDSGSTNGLAAHDVKGSIEMDQATTGANPSDRRGWIGTETVRTRFGDFAFENGYPTREAADALLDQLIFNRAIEVYLTQIPPVAIIETRRGLREFGARRPNQVVVWENLMDAQTLLLTANTETVYALGFLDLKTDGPTVV